jgi:pyruvate,orthophosphate dikinase
MTRIGRPVPCGFTISTEVCTYYYDHKRTYPKQLDAQIEAAVVKMMLVLALPSAQRKAAWTASWAGERA